MDDTNKTLGGTVLVDLDGTISCYSGKYVEGQIGSPIWSIVDLVNWKLKSGYVVKIFTARADSAVDVAAIQKWLVEVCKLPPLEVTNKKDFSVVEIFDDRAYHVNFNEGKVIWTGSPGSENLQNSQHHKPANMVFKSAAKKPFRGALK